jgi:hypothetical protein
VLPVISRIAEQVDSGWAAAAYRPDAFAELAAQALEEHEPPGFTDLAEAMSRGLALPKQRRMDQSFGQPALTLHYDQRFVVEALCWHTGSPAIHHHSFCGAFRVMTGRSVHSRYRFTERGRVAATIRVGDLELLDVAVLDRASVTQIPAGPALIHSAFHLDNPSMTVIVRTHDNGSPEYTYLPPGVAYEPAARSETLHKQLQLLDTLNTSGHPSYRQCVESMLATSDVYEGLEVLLRVHNHGLAEQELEQLTSGYLNRHGPGVDCLIPAVREQQRRSQLLGLRATVHDADTRFALACLLNAFDRTSFSRQFTRQAISADSGDVLAGCLRQVLGMSAEMDPILLLASTAMLAGVQAGAFSSWMATRTGESLGHEHAQLLDKLYRQLVESPLLTPLHR